MGRLAVIEIKCTLCGNPTKAILPDDTNERKAESDVKCEKCGKFFKFTDGLLYRPIGYASEEILDPYVCMICGEQLDFSFMAPVFMQNILAYHCRNCKNSICFKCAHTETCVVCGGIDFDKSTGKPPLAEKS
jgi:ribosomal protein S27E